MNESPRTFQRLLVDRSACAGHGLCYSRAPELLDCDEQGDPVVVPDELAAEHLNAAEAVVQSCPEQALSVESRVFQE
ncbi:ferredoxin [Nocardia sp. NPDC052254]|uniref:ferredoxin n=1 Tax=Nocardia sp. NPDC052254 TaxID=3155681 RepID=UPI003441AC9A